MEQMPKPNIERVPGARELIEGEPDAIFILTGALKYNDKKGRYETGSFQDKDENSGLATGGKDRVLAAAKIHRAFPESTVVPMSRPRDPNLPTYASVMRGELERKGVTPEDIVEEDESVDTISEFKQAARFRKEHGWNRLVFVSSDWHLPRSRALFNHIENFADTPEETELLTEFADAVRAGQIQVQFIGAGEVLVTSSPHYRKLFEKIAEDPGIKKRLELEEKALDQIKAGSYGKYALTKKIASTL